jgi:hypothetical protein
VHPTDDFEVDRWLSDLEADAVLLEEVHDLIAGIGAEDDDKLTALRAFLATLEPSERVLIFSEAEATVEYLYEQLNPGGWDPSIERLSGSNRDRLQAVIKRFAPNANLKRGERMPGSPVRVLIATDLISEGQNLQDCNRVVNYDLHWNPVRMIQRFGRVDRIGTTFETIYLHNFWPDTAVDAELSLTDRLGRRIQAFHDFIGLDAQLLSASERLNPGAMYRIYEEQRLPEQDDILDEVASYQRGVALLQKLQQEDPALWQTIAALPDGIRAARPVREPATENRAMIDFQRAFDFVEVQLPLGSPRLEIGARTPLDEPQPGETLILFKHGDRPVAYAVGDDCQPRPVTTSQFLGAVECEPDTPAAPLPADINQRVTAAYEATRRDATTRIGRARRPGTDSRLRRYLSRQLNLARESADVDAEEVRRIGILQQIFLSHLPPAVLSELQEVRRMELSGASLIRRLEALRERHRLNPPDPADEAAESASVDVVHTVCSEGLIG